MSELELKRKLIESNVRNILNKGEEVAYRNDDKGILISTSFDDDSLGVFDPLDWGWSFDLYYNNRKYGNCSNVYDKLVELLGDHVNDIYDNHNNTLDFFDELMEYATTKGLMIRPVKCYEHSMISFSQSALAKGFDESVCGFAVAKLSKELTTKDLSDEWDQLLNVYTQYANGQIYTVSVFNTLEDDDIIDSVGGVYKDDIDNIVEDFKGSYVK